MWISAVDREEFLGLVFRHEVPPVVEAGRRLPVPNGGELLLIWNEPLTAEFELPHTVVVPDDGIRDFFAWVATYLPQLTPFTAFVRVFEGEPPVMEPTCGRADGALLALVVAEALAEARDQNLSELSLSACMSTFSFPAARALWLGHGVRALPFLAERWTQLLRVADAPPRLVPPPLVVEAFAAVSCAINGPSTSREPQAQDEAISAACLSLRNHGEISAEAWDALTRDLRWMAALREGLSGSLEARVRELDLVVARLVAERRTDPRAAFLVGFLLSGLSSGALEHNELARSLRPEFQGVVTWYCACVGLREQDGVLDAGNGLLRWIRRELTRPVTPEPTCDVGLEELEVRWGGGAGTAPEFRTSVRSRVVVELLAGVNGLVAFPGRRAGPAPAGQGQQTLWREGKEDPFRALGDAIRLASRLYEASTDRRGPPKPVRSRRKRRKS